MKFTRIASKVMLATAALGMLAGAGAGIANAQPASVCVPEAKTCGPQGNPFISNGGIFVGDGMSSDRCTELANAWGGACVYQGNGQYQLNKNG